MSSMTAAPIAVRGDVDPRAVEQLRRCAAAGDAVAAAICADGHVGYSQPIGGVVAYRDHVSPSGVGYDIGCGNKAVCTDVLVADLRDDVARVMDEIVDRISFGVGRKNDEPVDHPVLDQIRDAAFEPQRALLETAAEQLGTVGAGNHYVDLFAGDDGYVWVGVHFGSRGFGHKTASGFLRLAAGLPFDDRKEPKGEMDSPPVLLPIDEGLGQSYIEAMNLAGAYAYAGRDVVVDKVLQILGTESTFEVHNHHNFCIAAGQLVPTTAGPKRMDEIRPDDEVYAYSEQGLRPTRVVDAWRSGEREIYTLRIGPRRLRCSGDHPILIVADGETRWRSARDLARGDIVVCAEGYYPETNSWGEGRARFVGACLGDGWIRHDTAQRGYTVGRAIGTGDEPHTSRYHELAAEIFPNTGRGQGWKIDAPGHFGLSCSSKSVWTAMVKMGLGARSSERHVPVEAFGLPINEKLSLLAGYVDADGSVHSDSTSNYGRVKIISVSRGLVEDLRELAIACSLQVTVIHESSVTTNYGDASTYSFTIAAGSAALLPLWHETKTAKQRETTRSTKGLSTQYLGGWSSPIGAFGRRLLDIEVGPPEPVYDLTVEDDSHSFIVEGVVTHNCWLEQHHGETVWVIRKGCTPAFPGQQGFVGSTMGEDSVILSGSAHDGEKTGLLYSTVHGAGRVMSRTAAAGKSRKRWSCSNRDCDWVQQPGEPSPMVVATKTKGAAVTAASAVCPRCGHGKLTKRWVQERPGLVDWDAARSELARRGVILKGGAADEAPQAYKRLDEVLAAHADTIEIAHRLTPIGVAMATADTFDPFKD